MLYSIIRTLITSLAFIVPMHVMIGANSIDQDTTPKQPEVELEGHYSGYVFLENKAEKVQMGLSVTAVGDNQYEAVLYYGGLPWEKDSTTEEKTDTLSGTYTNYTLRLSNGIPLEFQFIHNRYTALDKNNSYMGHLEKVIRVDGSSEQED